MSQLIPFAKLQAAGNDFVVLDASVLSDKEPNEAMIKMLCDRNYGIGSDGVIVMDHLAMRYFNSDGTVGAMCGNGLRAAVLYAYVFGDLGCDEFFEIQADDGIHKVKYVNNDDITVEILNKQKTKKEINLSEKLPTNLNVLGYFDTGVPHVVIEVENDFETLDVYTLGKKIRNDSTFYPIGTNVNFCYKENGHVRLRTYERGVEQETLACGTGATATALAYGLEKSQQIVTRGGILNIFKENDRLFLNGSARMAFVGQTLLEGS